MKKLCIGAALLITFAAGSAFSQEIRFPHFATGGGITSEILITNLTAYTQAVPLQFFGDGGVALANPTPRIMTIRGHGSSTYKTSGDGPVVTGWVLVSATYEVSGVINITVPGVGSAAVGAYGRFFEEGTSYYQQSFLVPVRRDATGVNSGIAIMGCSIDSINDIPLILTLRDSFGIEISAASVSIKGGGHIARFITEFFPDAQWMHDPSFDGTLAIEGGCMGITAFRMGLGPGPAQFITFPVAELR